MATVTHYIYSHYDPPTSMEGEEAEQERTEDDEKDPWLSESTFGVNRRLKNAPRFVSAIVPYDEVNNMLAGASSSISSAEAPSSSPQVSSWYRSLPRSSNTLAIRPQVWPRHSTTSSSASNPVNPNPSSPGSSSPAIPVPQRQTNNWFSSQPINTGPSSSRSTPIPTLADILSREPPPERKEEPFVPPVFLHIGPSNKGFTMLQQSGWSEGEALGASAPRRTLSQKALEKRPTRTILDDCQLSIKTEEREVTVDSDDEVREVHRVEVVDLTLSDSEEDVKNSPSANLVPLSTTASHNPIALLTPIATTLKADRLGIGLKAKVGPNRESKKRVTHNQAALAAHIRANEKMRVRKALLGRGAKSFARMAKAEADSRKRLLASLNAD